MVYFDSGMTKELSTEEKLATLFTHIGNLQSEIDRLNERLAFYENLRQSVLKNKMISADETGVNINGKNNWPGHSKMIKLLLLLSTQTGDIKQLNKSCRRVYKTICLLDLHFSPNYIKSIRPKSFSKFILLRRLTFVL